MWWLKAVGGCCDTMADCHMHIYAHVSDGVKWHRLRAHGGVWWCAAALGVWAAGEAWCGGVWTVCAARAGGVGTVCSTDF